MSPPSTETATPSQTPWPFLVKAEVIAVPARPVQLGLWLLAGIFLALATLVYLIATSPPYILVKGG